MATNYNFSDNQTKIATIDGARTLYNYETDTVFVLDAAAGATVTLPSLEVGLKFTFVVGAAFATTNWVIASAEGDNISGIISDMGTTVAGVPAGAEDQINFVATAESIGDWVEFIADAGNSQWLVRGACALNGGITATDPA